METVDAVSSTATIRLAAGAALSVSATEAVDIPTHLAQRCDLLLELREQAEGSYVNLPLPLSVAELKAWTQCALHSDSAGGGEGDQQCLAHEDTLLKGLKVRPAV